MGKLTQSGGQPWPPFPLFANQQKGIQTMSRPNTPKDIELNRVFTVAKGARQARWKIIKHPFFDAFAIVSDHRLIIHDCPAEDMKHISGGASTIDKAWQQAYDCT